MPKGRVLTPDEREQIQSMHEAGTSARDIAKALTRSKTVVLNYLKNPSQYAQIKRSGRKRKLSRDDERRLFAALFQSPTDINEHVEACLDAATAVHDTDSERVPLRAVPPLDVKRRSAEQIKREFNVPLSTRRIQQLLSEWRRDARREQDNQQQQELERASIAARDDISNINSMKVSAHAAALDALPPIGQANCALPYELYTTVAASSEPQDCKRSILEEAPAVAMTTTTTTNAGTDVSIKSQDAPCDTIALIPL